MNDNIRDTLVTRGLDSSLTVGAKEAAGPLDALTSAGGSGVPSISPTDTLADVTAKAKAAQESINSTVSETLTKVQVVKDVANGKVGEAAKFLAKGPKSFSTDLLNKNITLLPGKEQSVAELIVDVEKRVNDLEAGRIDDNYINQTILKGVVESLKEEGRVYSARITDVAGNVLRKDGDVSADDIRNLMSTAADFLGDPNEDNKIFDEPIYNMYGSILLNTAIAFGVPSLIERLLESKVKPTREQLLRMVVSAAAKGDHESTVKLARKVGLLVVRTTYPDITNRILRGYRVPRDARTSDHKGMATSLIADLVTLDPNWLTDNGVSKLDNLSGISIGATTVLNTVPSLHVPILLAKRYRPQQALTILRKSFKYANFN